MNKGDIGVIGLSVMGRSLAFNMADHGFSVGIYNRTNSVIDEAMGEYSGEGILIPSYSVKDFVGSLKSPRRVFIMVKAGKAVEAVIDELVKYMEKGDIIIDGGNSYFEDTIRRERELSDIGIRFMGVGVSGGEEGARFGPAIMPGGAKDAYEHVGHILEAISAKVNGEPCCTYIGENAAGHYVKMVHNGIEYGDMQLISEAYSILKAGGYSNGEAAEIFKRWNEGRLKSYLIEITADILTKKDDSTGRDMIDVILDRALQKGTGRWTSEQALALGIDISVIEAALNARYISAIKDERVRASRGLSRTASVRASIKPIAADEREKFENQLENALYVGKIISYAQGFRLLSEAQGVYGWELDFAAIAKIFRGGCIIRAQFLDDISNAFRKNERVENLLLTDFFSEIIEESSSDLREAVIYAISNGIPAPSMNNALSYLDSYTSERLSANMIQAQRDYFGAHEFERVDMDGSFHYEWVKSNE